MRRPLTAETICGLATPKGISAIAVIRVSGKETFPIIERIFVGKKRPSSSPSYSLLKGHLFDPSKRELVDEVLIAIYHSPNSYTGEDMVEIFCHGGIYCPERILALLLSAGCRPAYPGEFTQRRFLAGKIDLVQAESLLSLISARTELQAKAALRQMSGVFSRRIKEIADSLKELLARVEHKIEFEESGEISEFLPVLTEYQEKVLELLKKGERESFIKEGVNCVIVGKANVGKSSLFNRLVEKERALVTPLPGTTRDAIEETISLGGLPFRLIDTCGLRKRRGKIEALGWKKTKDYLASADLVILILDNSRPLTLEDWEIINATAKQKRILVRNKSDLKSKWGDEGLPSAPLRISCQEGTGIGELVESLRRQFLNGEEEFYISEMRHVELLRKASEALARGRASSYLEILAYELKEALSALGEIIGETTSEEILERIFSRFCVGK